MSQGPTTVRGYEPDYVVAPGEILSEALEERAMTQADLARRTDLSTKHVNQIMTGAAPISPDTALALERVLGMPARLWLGLEATYREALTRRAAMDADPDDIRWARRFPIAELSKRGLLRRCSDGPSQLAEVLAFLGVASRSAWEQVFERQCMAYRKARAGNGDECALAAWLRVGELRAAAIETRPYERNRFLGALDEVRSLTRIEDPEDWFPSLQKTCAESGVAVVVEPELPKSSINGVARWLGPDRALIQLSARHKWLDIFWFSFFHEAGHLALHAKRGIFIDGRSKEKDVDPVTAEMEREADEFASRVLIPREFEGELPELDLAQVNAFAERVGVGAWIVLGRLKHDGHLSWAAANHLRPRLAFQEP